MVMEVVQEDIEEDSMQCAIHPSKNNNTPGAICAFCLQEKLGNLVSSAFSVAIFLSSPSSPSSPSSKSAINVTSTTTTTTTTTIAPATATLTSSAITLHRSASTHSNQIFTRRTTLPFLLVQRMNKKKTKDGDVAIRRCNSTTTPRHDQQRESSRAKKRGFWSFLYPSSKLTISKKPDKTCKDAPGFIITSPSSKNMRNGASRSSKEWKTEDNMEVEKQGISSDKVASARKVSRSRSVGCGSKSFSGDFFGRLSTGLGDCTLRRVESQREGKAKNKMHRNGGDNNGGQDCIKERVKCGRIFGSFLINHASSSSSSSFEDQISNRRTTSSNVGHHHNNQSRAFATPIRFFSTKYSNGIEASQSNNVAPNLLAVGS